MSATQSEETPGGVSAHYIGDRGAAYTAHYQADADHPGYAIDFSYFKPYIRSEHSVLDFGCGNGGMLRHIAGMASRADGMEVNPTLAVIARGGVS